jgi:hypothetical protein
MTLGSLAYGKAGDPATKSGSATRQEIAMHRLVLVAGLGVCLASGAAAQEVSISDIRTQAFLERSGKLSDDLSTAGKPLKNLPRPGNELGEPANALLVTLVFKGAKNSEASNKIARDMAQVTVKQMAGDVQKVLLYRVFGGFSFGETGQTTKAFMLDDAVCAPVEIDVKVGRTRKTETLDLSCEAPAVAQADVTTTGSVKQPARR